MVTGFGSDFFLIYVIVGELLFCRGSELLWKTHLAFSILSLDKKPLIVLVFDTVSST